MGLIKYRNSAGCGYTGGNLKGAAGAHRGDHSFCGLRTHRLRSQASEFHKEGGRREGRRSPTLKLTLGVVQSTGKDFRTNDHMPHGTPAFFFKHCHLHTRDTCDRPVDKLTWNHRTVTNPRRLVELASTVN